MKNAAVTIDVSPKTPNEALVSFSGRLTVDNAPGFREMLLEILEQYDAFVFKTRDVDSLDLSFYQLLISARKSLDHQKKKYRFDLSLPAGEMELLEQAGFDTNFR